MLLNFVLCTLQKFMASLKSVMAPNDFDIVFKDIEVSASNSVFAN